MSNAIQTGWEKAMSYDPMRKLAAYLQSSNFATQAVAVDSNANDIQTTGGGACMINGQLIMSLAADAAYDISAEPAYAAWATGTAYTTISEVTQVDKTGVTRHYVCILNHTSATALNKPGAGFGTDWETYWRPLDKWAEDWQGDVCPDGETRYYLICANSAGTLRGFKAGDADGVLKIPAFDPTRYVAVGIVLVAPTAAASDHTIGAATPTLTTSNATYAQIVGPVFPDFDYIS